MLKLDDAIRRRRCRVVTQGRYYGNAPVVVEDDGDWCKITTPGIKGVNYRLKQNYGVTWWCENVD